jgi:hypothetical protein
MSVDHSPESDQHSNAIASIKKNRVLLEKLGSLSDSAEKNDFVTYTVADSFFVSFFAVLPRMALKRTPSWSAIAFSPGTRLAAVFT